MCRANKLCDGGAKGAGRRATHPARRPRCFSQHTITTHAKGGTQMKQLASTPAPPGGGMACAAPAKRGRDEMKLLDQWGHSCSTGPPSKAVKSRPAAPPCPPGTSSSRGVEPHAHPHCRHKKRSKGVPSAAVNVRTNWSGLRCIQMVLVCMMCERQSNNPTAGRSWDADRRPQRAERNLGAHN